jgi:NAD(P)-dependent dehydrogenase (short-subunit alcohol dehydrogenase family)
VLLKDKTAIVYGAGGQVGSAVSRAFAREGARVFLTGPTAEALDAAAEGIVGADTAEVDAADAVAIDRHFSYVIEQTGSVDISVNLIGLEDVQGQELASISLDDYLRPIELGARTHFLTSQVAARHMSERGRGVIMALTATPVRLALPLVGGFGAACSAIARPAPRATAHRRHRRTLPRPQRHQHRLPRHRPDPALQHQIPPMTAHQFLSYVRSPGHLAGFQETAINERLPARSGANFS